MKLPHRKTTIMSVLAFVASLGGYGGYTVVKDEPRYNPWYDYQIHTVKTVTDGDTLVLDDDTRVRLLGIDAPEFTECYGPEAQLALYQLAQGKQVRLERDITARDEFGRYLRYVFLYNPDPNADAVLLNRVMVRNGFAIDSAVGPDKRYRLYLVQAREQAKREEQGIWSNCPKYTEQIAANASADTQPTDPACIIKGNISNEGLGKTYFVPGCGNYGRVKIDTKKGEQYFCSTSDAEASGFTLSASCLNNKVTQ